MIFIKWKNKRTAGSRSGIRQEGIICLAAERQAMIVELIRENGSVQVDELARELNVSSMTIRRDLVKLENSNMIERCHGGAVAKLGSGL